MERPSFPRQLARYFALTLRQASEDSVFLTASALAFVTVLSLVPLLTAFSFIGARVFQQYPQRTLEVFVQVLPYSEESVVEKMEEFLDQAETLHGFGLAVFLTTALLAFSTVEESLNRIWNVSRRRPLRVRMLSFLLLLFWGPVLIGVTFSSLIALRQSPALRQAFAQSLLLNLLPLAATIVGLTTLYWLVPYTAVRFRNALAGGLLAAILLEMLRVGFGAYVRLFQGVNVVYGSFAFALLFMISIELTWSIILLGSEAAYTAQHFRVLSHGLHRHPPVQAAWVGLAAVALIARRFARGEPVLSLNALADRLSLPSREMEVILHPLLTRGILRAYSDRGYFLASDPHRLKVEQVLHAYDHRAGRSAELAGGDLQERLEELIGDLARARAERLGDLTVSDLASPPPPSPA
ncbi:MAG: YhjD/YihY/BrkB family envelope integrity protein [Thermoanaerobaculia bacterium]